ncbi:MAG: 50S ribosomal protein L9 [Herpetosiphon sp.]|nr:50S ribosomal protein L9 [Herpetosiphon sp.]
MKVMLLHDVEKLGTAGEVKEVSGGYGRNYLLPKKLAVFATPGLIKQAEEKLAKQRKLEAKQRESLRGLSEKINGQTLKFLVKVGEQDRLYGSVTSGDIAEKLAGMIGEDVDRRKIQLDEPIKRTGLYSVAIRLMSGVEPRINVVVEDEDADAQAAAPVAEAVQEEAPAVELEAQSDEVQG